MFNIISLLANESNLFSHTLNKCTYVSLIFGLDLFPIGFAMARIAQVRPVITIQSWKVEWQFFIGEDIFACDNTKLFKPAIWVVGMFEELIIIEFVFGSDNKLWFNRNVEPFLNEDFTNKIGTFG
jgi:hypothetical protein